MSISQYVKELEEKEKKSQEEVQSKFDLLVKDARIRKEKMEDFFKTEGGKIFLDYLKDQRDICLSRFRLKPTPEESLRIQERYDFCCTIIELFESNLDRVKPS